MGLELFAVLVAGFAVALAAYFLQGAVLARVPRFDGDSVGRLGVAIAAMMFALSGPIIVLRAITRTMEAFPARRFSAIYGCALALVLVWAWALGVVALGAGRAVAMG